jgi:hypothetical protein
VAIHPLLTPETAAAPDPLKDLDPTVIDFPDKVSPMETAFHQAVDVQPDHAANVLDLSSKLDQPPEFVDQNIDVARKAASVPPSQYFADVTKAYPLTADFLSDPKNMAVAKDDIHNLTKTESLVQGYSGMDRLWRTANSAMANLNADIAKFPATLYDIAAVPQNLLAKAVGHPEMQVQASEGFRNNPIANFYSRQMEAWKPPPLPDYIDLVKSGDFAAAGQKVAESLVDFAPALAISAMSSGAGLATIAGQSTSAALDRNRELGIDPATGGLNAAYHGAFAAALMDVGVLGPFKKWGESLAGVVGPDTAKKVMMGMFSAMGHSSATFGTMSGATSFANDYSDYATGVNPHALEGSLKRSSEAAIGGMLQGGVMGAFSASVGTMQRGANIRRTMQAQQVYDALQKHIDASAMYDRAPELAEGLLDHQIKGTPLETIGVPAEKFDTYFQSQNINPDDLARDLGISDQLKAARETGADVTIPLSKWAGKMAKTEHYAALKNDIRFIEGEPTVNEGKEIEGQTVKGIQAENEKAAAENPLVQEGRDYIFEDQKRQMEALGQLDPKMIEANAKIGADLITNLAIKNKIDPKEYYAKNPLRVINPSAEAVAHATERAAQGTRLAQDQQITLFQNAAQALDPKAEFVTKAALRLGDKIYTGRHHGEAMQEMEADGHPVLKTISKTEDGFVTNTGRFVSRKEALKIAERQGQLAKPNIGKTLDSDSLNSYYAKDSNILHQEAIEHSDSDKGFKQAVDDAFSGKGNFDDPVSLGRIPAVLRSLGATDTFLVTGKDVIVKAREKHQIPVEDIKRLVEQIRDPLMVFKSVQRADSWVVLTEIKNAKGQPVTAAIWMDRPVGRSVKVHDITSMNKRSLSEIKDWITGRTNGGQSALLYADEQKATAWLQSNRLYAPSEGVTPSGKSIRTREEFLKAQNAPPDSTPNNSVFFQGENPESLPVVKPEHTGEPYGLFSYNSDMNPEGKMRSLYTIYGDPEHPLLKVGLDSEGKPLPGAGNTTQTLDWFQQRGIPIKGMEPRAAEKGWKPLDSTQGEALFQSAWHGSPHDFEKFSLQKIGTGEGHQAYGWGLYFAGDKEVAEYYKKNLTRKVELADAEGKAIVEPKNPDTVKGRAIQYLRHAFDLMGADSDPKDIFGAARDTALRRAYNGFNPETAERDGRKPDPKILAESKKDIAEINRLEKSGVKLDEKVGGRLYKVDIPEDHEYLDYDKKLSEQPNIEKIFPPDVARKLVKEWEKGSGEKFEEVSSSKPKNFYDMTGNELYATLADIESYKGIKDYGEQSKAASLRLASLGVPGIKFLDEQSRDAGSIDVIKSNIADEKAQIEKWKNSTHDPKVVEAQLETRQKRLSQLQRTLKEAEKIKPTFNYVVFDDKLVKVLDKQYQGQPDPGVDPESNPRAFLQTTPRETLLAMIKPDASSYPHEMAHYWLKGFHSFILSGNAEAKHLEDWGILKDWLKVDDAQKEITVDQQEKFAKGFEVYVAEGKAPSVELATVFAKFRKWISAVYKHLVPYSEREQQLIKEGWLISKHPSLNVEVSPQMRGFMDRMLASEDEIAFAQKDISIDPNSEMHIEGLDPKVQARLDKMRGDAHEEAVRRLTTLQMKELSDEHKAKMTQEATQARIKAEDAVKNSPIQTSMRAIEKTFGRDPLKLTQEFWLKKMNAEDRSQFELLAEARGFSSGDELAQKIVQEKPFEVQVKAMVDAHMAQFPDLRMTPEIKEEAQKAVHNERSTEVMALERAILQTKAQEAQGRVVDQQRRAAEAKIEAQAARQKAEDLIAAKPISAAGKFLPYFTAERNAAMKVQKALEAKDFGAAADAKRQQMLNHALASEAFKVRGQIERWNDYVKSIQGKDKELFKQEEHFNQVASLLERFGKGREDYDPATKTEPLAAWHERMVLQDEAVAISPWLLDESVRKLFASLTVDEAHDVVNALKNIQRVANAQQNFYRLMDGASVQNTVLDLTNEAVAYNKPHDPEGIMRRQNTILEKAKTLVRGYDSTLRTIENIALKLGGWNDSSLWTKALWDPVQKAAETESNLMKPLNEGYEKILTDHYTEKERRDLVNYDEAKYIPELGQSVRRIELLMMALNTGNESNRARLFGNPIVGVGPETAWGERPVMDLLQKHLTENDWKFVNETWKLIHTLWPKEVEIHKEITGFTPSQVDPLPFTVTTADGKTVQMDGGYFPLKADSRQNLHTEIREQMDDPLYTERNPAWKATTKTGHLQSRLEGAKYPVALDSSIIQRHLRDAVHDIAFRATVIDLRRLVGNQQFADTVKNYAGEEQYKVLRDWVGSVASGNAREKAALSYWENVSKVMRAKYSAAVLMFNPKIVTQNLSNAFLYAGAAEGYDWNDAAHAFINKGLLDFIPSSLVKSKRAEEFRQRIYEKSAFMRDKASSPDYSIQQTFDKLTGKTNKLSDFFYGYFSAADELTSLPTWQTAYEKKISLGESEDKAVAFADTVIRRSVGAARKYETAPIFRGTEMDKTLATFQGFMNAQQNRWERERGIWGQNYIKNSPRFAGYVAAHFGLFAAASNILSGNLPSFTDEDKMKKWMKSLSALQIPNDARSQRH